MMPFFTEPIVLNSVKALLAILMAFSNSALVVVTFKAKNLNSTCNWLIAANSACIAIYSLTYFVQFGIVLINPDGIPLWQCCLLVALPLFFVCCQYVLFPLIALDRLIGAIFPLKQMGKRYKRRYMLFALIASTSYGIFIVATAVNKSIINFSQNLVLCMTSEPPPTLFANCSWALTVCSVILYLALWVRVKLMASIALAREDLFNTRKFFCSLMAIFLVETVGWVSNWSVKMVLIYFNASTSVQWNVMSYCSFLLQFALSLNAPILYTINAEYRHAFQAVLFGKTVSLRPSATTGPNNFVRIVHPISAKEKLSTAAGGVMNY